jgi:hypothetical protein
LGVGTREPPFKAKVVGLKGDKVGEGGKRRGKRGKEGKGEEGGRRGVGERCKGGARREERRVGGQEGGQKERYLL